VSELVRARRRSWTFEFEGATYPYFVRRHTWYNERTVELALALPLLRQHSGQPVLEVGNVTRQYGLTGAQHLVVDKYELAAGVQPVDIVDFEPQATFPLVLSLSTIEHVGFDEDVVDPNKPIAAADVLRRCVAPGGDLLVTFPLSYNQTFDAQVRAGRFADLTQVGFLKRISQQNRWEEVDLEAVAGTRYGTPFPKANAIAVWRWRNPA
jgi:hypothetical protein